MVETTVVLTHTRKTSCLLYHVNEEMLVYYISGMFSACWLLYCGKFYAG